MENPDSAPLHTPVKAGSERVPSAALEAIATVTSAWGCLATRRSNS